MACGGGGVSRLRLIQPGRASRRLYRQDHIAYGVQGERTPCAATWIVATFPPETPRRNTVKATVSPGAKQSAIDRGVMPQSWCSDHTTAETSARGSISSLRASTYTHVPYDGISSIPVMTAVTGR